MQKNKVYKIAPFRSSIKFYDVPNTVMLAQYTLQSSAIPEAFIKSIAPLAMDTQVKYGIPASVTIAQAILESSWGKSTLTKKANNYFGIRADKKYLNKGGNSYNIDTAEYINGVRLIDKKAAFRKYKNRKDSFYDHAKFLQDNSRYKKLFNTSDWKQWIYGLQDAGYSTSPTYAITLLGLINKYNLSQYDKKATKRNRRRKAIIFGSITVGLIGSAIIINHYAKKHRYKAIK